MYQYRVVYVTTDPDFAMNLDFVCMGSFLPRAGDVLTCDNKAYKVQGIAHPVIPNHGNNKNPNMVFMPIVYVVKNE